ncbi:hypothetical protein E3N88_07843 [Mikania micrantha]|uniref:Uncharacterized protein n=1 Tax=Mikania micrantha TaxID=192012 RepID=A0A5N6PFN1_9ASTR|nr:hypothetical protein E3N88_07843 [Mikania micrantha]
MADVSGAITHRDDEEVHNLASNSPLSNIKGGIGGDDLIGGYQKHHNSSNHRPLRHIALASETSPEVRHGSSKEKRTKTTIIVTAFGGDRRREIPA